MKHICLQCGADFLREGNRPYRYCSRACTYTAQTGRPSPQQRTLIARHCQFCGSQFQSPSSAGARASYCSRSCQGLAKSIKGKSPRRLSVSEAAYLAGQIDADGSILIDPRKDRHTPSRPSIRVDVTCCHRPLMDWLIETTGLGYVIAHPANRYPTARQTIYHWRASSLSAAAILFQTEPFMMEKRERARQALASFGSSVDTSSLDSLLSLFASPPGALGGS